MYDKDDHFGRWVQFFCGILLLLIGGGLLYWSWTQFLSLRRNYNGYSEDAVGAALFVLGARCLWYAATGKNNLNKDDF
jgi:hypothetical protein